MSDDTKTDDGGPAFPFEQYTEDEHKYRTHIGMSLLDYFAGQALANPNLCHVHQTVTSLADTCYKAAEAMIAERNRRNGTTT